LAPHQTADGQLADQVESEQLEKQQLGKGLPKTLNAYQNHVLYALKRHLTTTEAFHPEGKE